MSDIVKRLRDPSSGSPRWLDTMQEAAAEIARLRAEVEALRALLGDDGARGLGDRGA